MTKSEFNMVIKKIRMAFRKPDFLSDVAERLIWYDMLKEFEIVYVGRAAYEYIRSNKFLPMIADIYRLTRQEIEKDEAIGKAVLRRYRGMRQFWSFGGDGFDEYRAIMEGCDIDEVQRRADHIEKMVRNINWAYFTSDKEPKTLTEILTAIAEEAGWT